MTRSLPRSARRQRGVAVVTALLLTTLAVTIVASLFWQQQVQVRSVENQRLHLQTRWILRGALDWARLIVRQDGLDNAAITRADGVWATPLAETRLDQYVERERVEGEDYDATLQGRIVDAQSRYNLTNLAQAGSTSGNEARAFGQLLSLLQLDPNLAQAAAQYASRAAAQQAGAGSAPVAFQRVEDLLAVGFPQAAVERLRDYVVVLPVPTGVNVNTASAEVLAATVEGMSIAEAQSLVASLKRSPMDKAMFTASVQQQNAGRQVLADITGRSDWFLVLSQVRLDRAALESWSLIRRLDQSRGFQTSVVWIREI